MPMSFFVWSRCRMHCMLMVFTVQSRDRLGFVGPVRGRGRRVRPGLSTSSVYPRYITLMSDLAIVHDWQAAISVSSVQHMDRMGPFNERPVGCCEAMYDWRDTSRGRIATTVSRSSERGEQHHDHTNVRSLLAPSIIFSAPSLISGKKNFSVCASDWCFPGPTPVG